MTIQDVAPYMFPTLPFSAAGNAFSTGTAINLSSTGLKAGMIFAPMRARVVTQVLFRVTGKTTNGDVDVRLEQVDATTGLPNGTLWGTNTNGAVTINAASTYYVATLTGAATMAATDRVALVIVNTTGSYTIAVANTMLVGFPYCATHNGTSWSLTASGPLFELGDSSTWYPTPGVQPGVPTGAGINTGTTPDEVGIAFSMAIGRRVIGVFDAADIDGDTDYVLYDSGNNVVASGSVDKDIREQSSSQLQYVPFTAAYTIIAGATYRLMHKPTSVTSMTPFIFSMPSNVYRQALPWGNAGQYTSRTDAGAFTDVDTGQAIMAFLVDGDDLPASGLMLNSGMTGGMHG